MDKYELMVIIKPILTEEERLKVQKKFQAHIEKLAAKVTQTDVWGKRHLAYEISDHKEGYYIVYKIEMEPGKVAELEGYIKLNDAFIRHILILEKHL